MTLVTFAACAKSKAGAPVLLPAPLVSALMGDRVDPLRGSPDYSVGTLPTGYPSVLVPSGPVTIVGGMVTPDQIVAVFADSTRRLAAVFEQTFVQAGFTRPAPTPASGFQSGSGTYSYFCNDSATVQAEPLSGVNRHAAKVTLRKSRFSACSGMRGSLAREETRLDLPRLTAPAGARVRSSGGGYGGDGVSSRASMTGTALVPATVLAHYASQLTAAKWTAHPAAISPRIAAQYFEAADTTGAKWAGILMIVGDDTAIDLTLNMKLVARR
jgi:hypothetical protein